MLTCTFYCPEWIFWCTCLLQLLLIWLQMFAPGEYLDHIGPNIRGDPLVVGWSSIPNVYLDFPPSVRNDSGQSEHLDNFRIDLSDYPASRAYYAVPVYELGAHYTVWRKHVAGTFGISTESHSVWLLSCYFFKIFALKYLIYHCTYGFFVFTHIFLLPFSSYECRFSDLFDLFRFSVTVWLCRVSMTVILCTKPRWQFFADKFSSNSLN